MTARILLLALALAAGATAKPDPIKLSVIPRQSFAPATVRVTVQIEYNERNDYACIFYDALDGDTSSDCWTLYGNRKTFVKNYKDVGAGEYLFQALVHTADGDEHRTPQVVVNLIPRF